MKRMTNIALVLLGSVLLGGCHHAALPPVALPGSSTQPIDGPISQAQAIEIARQAVAANDTWANRAVYQTTAQDGGWSVLVWRITGYDSKGNPQFTPGGHRLVLIDATGRVAGYLRGR
jgi:hypothetical protein